MQLVRLTTDSWHDSDGWWIIFRFQAGTLSLDAGGQSRVDGNGWNRITPAARLWNKEINSSS